MRGTLIRQRRRAFAGLLLAAAFLPSTGYAHHGDVTTAGLLAGLEHPWTGLDHLAAMLAVGLWATLMRNQSIPSMLCATVVGVVAGACLGAYAVSLTSGEQITIVSVIVLGLFATTAGHARKPLAAALVALFCFFHGYVHTAETPSDVSPLAFSGGFLISMLALQLLGVVIGALLSNREALARGAGACCSALGLVLFISG
jgi:urease accessory protein